MEVGIFNKKIEYHWEDKEERYIDEENREWIWDSIKEGYVAGEIAYYDMKSKKRYFGYWKLKR